MKSFQRILREMNEGLGADKDPLGAMPSPDDPSAQAECRRLDAAHALHHMGARADAEVMAESKAVVLTLDQICLLQYALTQTAHGELRPLGDDLTAHLMDGNDKAFSHGSRGIYLLRLMELMHMDPGFIENQQRMREEDRNKSQDTGAEASDVTTTAENGEAVTTGGRAKPLDSDERRNVHIEVDMDAHTAFAVVVGMGMVLEACEAAAMDLTEDKRRSILGPAEKASDLGNGLLENLKRLPEDELEQIRVMGLRMREAGHRYTAALMRKRR